MAAEVKALAKPSLSAWTVNQLARREPMQVRALMTAGERLREAQSELLGGGDPVELQAALRRQRDVIEALIESAERVLESAGRPGIGGDAGADPRNADRRGRRRGRGRDSSSAGGWSRTLEPSGFGGPAVAPRRPHKRPARQQKRKDEEARKQRIEEAKQKVDDLRAAVAEQKDRLRRATSEARKAQAEVDRLTARLDEAKEALGRARST